MSRPNSLQFIGIILLITTLTVSACTREVPKAVETTSTAPLLVASQEPLATTEGETVTIRFACLSFEQGAFETLAASFEAQNPDIRIQFVAIDNLSSDLTDYTKYAFKIMSAADTAYFLVDLSFASQGLLRDLTPFIEGDETFAPEDFFPSMLETFQWHDRTWALPSQALMYFLVYDKPMFDAAGVSYPTQNWVLDDFLNATQRLTIREGPEITQYGFVDYAGRAQSAFILGSVDDAALLGQQLPLDAPVVVEAVRWYTDLALRYQVMPTHELSEESLNMAWGLIESQKVAMWNATFPNYYDFRDRQSRSVGLSPFPTTKESIVPAEMYGYMMSAGTEHPQESWRWLSFVSHRQVVGKGSMTRSSNLPARRSVAEQSGYWEQFDEEALDLVHYAAEHLFFTPPVEAQLELAGAVQNMFQGEPVEEALAAAQDAVVQYLAQEVQATPIPVVVTTPWPTGAAGATTTIITFVPPGPDAESYQVLADAFNQTYPDVQVQLISPNQVDRADCFGGMRAVDDVGTRAELLNLQPLLDADPSFSLDDFYPRFLDAFRFQGDLWGLPMQAQVRAIFYNSQIFDAAGLPCPQFGWTLDDFLSSAVALTKGEGAEKQYGFLPLNGDLSDLRTFLALQGAALWDEQGRPRFDTPEVVAAVGWYTNLALKYGVMPTFPEDLPDGSPTAQETRNALVREGRVAMWTDFIGVDRSSVWPTGVQVGIAPLPTQGQGQPGATEFLHEGLFIAADAPNPQACWEWLKFASAHAELLTNLPARRSVLESAAFAGQVGTEAVGTYQASLWYADVPLPAIPEAAAQLRWLYEALADILQGDNPEVALARAQQQAEK